MEHTNSSDATILVVDDDPTTINIMTAILGKSGYRIFSGRDGSECVEMTKKLQPDLILLDIDMPQMNGIEAVKRIKKKFLIMRL